ncbi:MAG TPA: VPDSG-CTERM sorting domain-containing protein, partial [Lacunisphaera sp.]|nr:VPDSG-CTERM sorting domain-containing protein [Lacunisphaera sp.]
DMTVQALNDVGGRDVLHVFGEPLVSTVAGLDPAWWPGPRGYFGLDLYDSSQTAIEIGSPWDFARFLDSGSVSISLGFKTENPYSGGGPQMGAVIRSGSLVLPAPSPSSSSVPDSGSTLSVTLLGLVAILAARRVARGNESRGRG